MIALQEIHKAFGSQVIFDGARLQINPGDRLAFVGPNGAGKSTLFKLILGLEEADGGRIIKTQGLSLGYLPQENAPLGETTVLAETLTPLQASEASDGMDLRREAEGKKILFGLEFRERDFAKPLSALSGGWRMRVALARLLLAQPDVLMLDEPTNHLDLDALLWFQNYLSRWKGSLLVISHDRAFVNAVVSAIVDVRGGQLYRYVGDYEAFLAQRELEEAQRLAAYKRQEKLIEDAEEFIRRFRAQASKAPQVQSRIKMLEKMELIELPPELKKVHIRFPQPTRTGQRVLSLHRVSKAYGETVVYRHLDMEFERGQKVALVGPNGAGKSTLLKLLAGVLAPDEGERRLGLNVEAGYYSQHRADMLDPERTVLEEALHTRRVHPELFVRTVLGTFLFQESAVFKKVKVLSGGEKSRLGLVKLLLDPPNVLLLDEPTTHLDLPSVEALVGALKAFEGTILFISHDLFFIRALADHTAWVPGEGRVVLYPGNYDYFLSRQNESASLPAVSMVEDRRQHLPSGVRSSAQDVQEWKASERARQRNRKRLNQRLRDIEDEREDLQARLGSVFVQSDYKKLMEIDGQLKALATEKENIVAQLAGDGVPG